MKLSKDNKKHFFLSPIKTSGFTLVEMVIYVGILGVTSVLAINAMLTMTSAYTKLRVSRDLNSSATAVLERVTRNIHEAYEIDIANSTLGTDPGRLTLRTQDFAGATTTIEFFVSNNMLRVKEGGVDIGALQASSTSVSNFVVRSISATNSTAIKVDLTMSATRGHANTTRNFFTTTVMRGSYY
ncbi:MAG: type II secretion system GspH family protein [Candidatus Pacebacteria bacterium]|jgi:type II secretory pathway pseudopilin PulG|nr:type II secretion system GspH family protein [Candidatus Paceibacterota bacterium]